MENKTKITNPLALGVLTHLYEKPRHPYDLAGSLRARGREQCVRINYGSLYTVINMLLKNNYIRELETKKEGNRPEKTVYAITNEGKDFMAKWMRELLSIPVKEFPQFQAALSFLPVLSPEEVVSLLETRLILLQKNIDAIKNNLQTGEMLKMSRVFTIALEYEEKFIKTECELIRSFIDDIKKNKKGLTTFWKKLREEKLSNRKDFQKKGRDKKWQK
jgi:DNA-binding PadR family transcriptional regulator